MKGGVQEEGGVCGSYCSVNNFKINDDIRSRLSNMSCF